MERVRQQCVLHPERGAVACCPQCHRFYCHECITEHDGEVLCRRCLSAQVEQKTDAHFWRCRKGLVRYVVKPLLVLAGLLLLWLIFILLGALLMRFPDTFHYETPRLSTNGEVRSE